MGLAVGQSSEQKENPAIVDAVKDKLIVTGFGVEDVGTRAASLPVERTQAGSLRSGCWFSQIKFWTAYATFVIVEAEKSGIFDKKEVLVSESSVQDSMCEKVPVSGRVSEIVFEVGSVLLSGTAWFGKLRICKN